MNRPWHKFYPKSVPYEITAPPISVFQLLVDSTKEHPEKQAVIDNDQELTYGELKEVVERFATSLSMRGFQKGDMLAIMLPNCVEYIIAFFAVQRLGGIAVQVNPMYQPRELEYILEDSGAKWFLTNQIQIEKLEKIGYLDKINSIIIDRNSGQENNLYDLIEKAENMPPKVSIDVENDIAILQYTGGTTGRSKGVMITHQNVVFNLVQNRASSISEDNENPFERIIGIAPMFHAMGLISMVSTIYRGGTIYPIARFEINNVIKLIRSIQPTLFSGSPTMYIALLNHPDLKPEDLKGIKSFSSGSAPLSVEIMRRFEKISAVPIIEAYGLSEATMMTHKNPPVGKRKPGSIGIPVPSTDCRIVDIETGTKEMEIGLPGELIIKGPQIMKGYWKKEKETANALRNGWLYTGDLAVVDEDGFFFIVGRKKDMIIAGGYNIYPLEIEEVIYQLPHVKEVCVFGVPDPYRGETVKVAIVLKDNETLTEQEVENWCNENLARYKVPRIIEFRTELPKTAVGKILRTKLIEQEKERMSN